MGRRAAHLGIALALLACRACGESSTCAVFGKNAIMQGSCDQSSDEARAWATVATFNGEVTWACELPESSNGPRFALCDESAGLLRFWYGGSSFKEVSLAPFTTPVGAVYSEGKVYVACFGNWPIASGTSGIVVVDLETLSVDAHYDFNNDGGFSHVHNVYAFEVDGKTQIFAATIGNPWTSPPVAGYGLMRLDMVTGKFDDSYTSERLSVRSAAQQSDGSIFVLTQEPAGQATVLARLEAEAGGFAVVAKTTLPSRSAGDGGADVFLGRELDTLFASDRGAGPSGKGMVYYYTYEDGAFTRHSGHETGLNPRYTRMLSNGDVVSCNQCDNSITFFQGLAATPLGSNIRTTTMPVMQGASFLIQSPRLVASTLVNSTFTLHHRTVLV